MCAAARKRSIFVTILAWVSLVFGCLAVWSFINASAWSPESYYWHSDVLWAVEYLSPPSVEERRVNDARAEAQSRYEASMAVFIASLGLMCRKYWARLLMTIVSAAAVVETALITLLFWSLRMFQGVDYAVSLVTITILGVVAWKLQSPSVDSEFRHERS